jgi:hypothetical protein
VLLDVSSSMYTNQGIEGIRSNVQKWVDGLSQKGHQVTVWTFANGYEVVDRPEAIAASVPERPQAGNPFTALYSTLTAALDDQSFRTIVVLSDGADNVTDTTGCDLCSVARLARREHIKRRRSVYTLGFGDVLRTDHDKDNRKGQAALRMIARAGGGEYYYAPTLQELPLDAIIRGTYGYKYTGSSLGTSSHDIRIQHKLGGSRAFSKRLGIRGRSLGKGVSNHTCDSGPTCSAVGDRLDAAGSVEAARAYWQHSVDKYNFAPAAKRLSTGAAADAPSAAEGRDHDAQGPDGEIEPMPTEQDREGDSVEEPDEGEGGAE